MPSYEETLEQIHAEGITDPEERRRRLAPFLGSYVPPEPEPEIPPTPEPSLAGELGVGIGRAWEGAKGVLTGRATPAQTTFETEVAKRQQREVEQQALIEVQETGQVSPETQQRLVEVGAPTEPGQPPPEEVATRQPTPEEQALLQQQQQQALETRQAGLAAFRPPKMPGMGRLRKAYGERRETYEKLGEQVEQQREVELGIAEQQAGLAELQARQEGYLTEARADEFERLRIRHTKREQERQERVDIEMNKIRGAMQELEAAPIDPGRLFKHPDGSRDYAKTIGAAISIALSGLGEALQGRGGNPALAIIERGIERDIQTQKDWLSRKRAGVGLQMNMLGQMRQQFANERQAETATRLLMLKSFDLKLQDVAQANPSLVAQTALSTARAAVNTRANELAGKLELDIRENTIREEKERIDIGIRQAGVAAQQMAIAQKAMAKAAPTAAPPGLRILPGDYVPDKKDKQKAQEIGSQYYKAKGALDKVVAHREKYAAEWINPRGTQLAREAIVELKLLKEMGATFTKMEKKLIGIPEDLGEIGWVLPRLLVIRENLQDRTDKGMQVYGYGLAGAPTAGFK
jgi:hypothetical protein